MKVPLTSITGWMRSPWTNQYLASCLPAEVVVAEDEDPNPKVG
jgi:hypothetical protein